MGQPLIGQTEPLLANHSSDDGRESEDDKEKVRDIHTLRVKERHGVRERRREGEREGGREREIKVGIMIEIKVKGKNEIGTF